MTCYKVGRIQGYSLDDSEINLLIGFMFVMSRIALYIRCLYCAYDRVLANLVYIFELGLRCSRRSMDARHNSDARVNDLQDHPTLSFIVSSSTVNAPKI